MDNNGLQNVTDREYEVQVFPVAEQNWADAHNEPYIREWTEAEYAEITEWAEALRGMYDTGECEITWRGQ